MGEINIGSFLFHFCTSFSDQRKKNDKSDCTRQMDRSRKSSGIVGLMKRDTYIRPLETVLNRGAGCVLQAGVSGSADVI